MTTLTTMIAELEEALKAATPGPWIVSSQNKKDVEGGPHSDHNGFRHLVSDSYTGLDDVDEANARLIALMRNSLPTLIEALKRQGEALEPFAEIAKYDIGNSEANDDLFRPMMFHNRGPLLTVGMFRRARAALTAHKEKSDV